MSYTKDSGHPVLEKLSDGTEVRYKFVNGEYSGTIIKAKVEGGHILYQNEKYSPTGAARAALKEIRGDNYELNGWEWWKYYDKDNDEWRKLIDAR